MPRCSLCAVYADVEHWFTIIAPDSKRVDDILGQISSALSLDSSKVLNVSLKRLFKLDARFNVTT